MTIYYYFLRFSYEDVSKKEPYITEEFLGEIGDFIEIDGVGYIIEDYAEEAIPEEIFD